MPGKRYTAEQIIGLLRQAEVELAKGRTVGEVSRAIGVSEQSYYRWYRFDRAFGVTNARNFAAGIFPGSLPTLLPPFPRVRVLVKKFPLARAYCAQNSAIKPPAVGKQQRQFKPHSQPPQAMCAATLPCSAASRYHFAASAWFCRTPMPLSYMTPSWNWAAASPRSANGRNSRTAVA